MRWGGGGVGVMGLGQELPRFIFVMRLHIGGHTVAQFRNIDYCRGGTTLDARVNKG